MHLLRAAAALALTVALVSGCGDDDPEVAPPEQSTQVSTPTEVTSEPTHTPTKPVLPDAAKKPTKAGAEAFIHYYWALVDYATLTGSVKPIDDLAGPRCTGCNGGTTAIREVYDQGGAITSTPYVIRSTALYPVKDDTSNKVFIATVRLTLRNHVVMIPGKKKHRVSHSKEAYRMTLVHVDGSWRVDELEAVE